MEHKKGSEQSWAKALLFEELRGTWIGHLPWMNSCNCSAHVFCPPRLKLQPSEFGRLWRMARSCQRLEIKLVFPSCLVRHHAIRTNTSRKIEGSRFQGHQFQGPADEASCGELNCHHSLRCYQIWILAAHLWGWPVVAEIAVSPAIVRKCLNWRKSCSCFMYFYVISQFVLSFSLAFSQVS